MNPSDHKLDAAQGLSLKARLRRAERKRKIKAAGLVAPLFLFLLSTFIIPILACLIGWIFLRETITIKIALGGGLILAGIALATFPRFRKKENAGV